MIEERCLQVESYSICEEPQERTEAAFAAFECLQEDRIEETQTMEEAKYRSYLNRCLLKSRITCCLLGSIAILLAIAFLILFVQTSRVKDSLQQRSDWDIPTPCSPACPTDWIGYKGKCYFFSDGGRNWTYSQSFCNSYGSSLAVIENEPEKLVRVDSAFPPSKVFVVRYKCLTDYWIGLKKDLDQTWKWADGAELNGTLEVKGEGGNCAFLNSNYAISSRCYIQRKWICSHHDAYARNKSSSVRK